MGTICILLGLIILIAFTGVGFLAAGTVLSNELYMSLLGLSEPTMVYVAVVGVCAFIGLLICLTVIAFNFVGDGLRDAFDPRSKE